MRNTEDPNIILQTADGHYVGTVVPIFPMSIEQVVLYNSKFYLYDSQNIWKETPITIVREPEE